MSRKTEYTIFLIGLTAVAVLVAAGIFYFNAGSSGTPFAAKSPATSSVPAPQNLPQTIPTSTIIIPASSTSMPPAALSLPYTLNTLTSNSTYWPKAWGAISFADNDIVFVPDPATHGANSFISGASSWKNYTVNADTSWLMGGWFDIVARVANNTQNFVYCEFGSNGTEIVERVNGMDTQLAYAAASTTAARGSVENFGMKVYGNDIACMMANQEVVGTEAQGNESPTGGIGFVVFGQPQQQKSVEISNIAVSSLIKNTIITPFPPVAAVVTPPAPVVFPPPPGIVPTPATPNALSLPYSTTNFTAGDWGDEWGSVFIASGTLTLSSNNSITSAGAFLNGSNTWTDYVFDAYVEWVKGQIFELVARRADAKNLAECVFSAIDSAHTAVSINTIVNGQTATVNQGETITDNATHSSAVPFEASMKVQGQTIQCGLDNELISADINSGELSEGGIGFITWDPQEGNSEINIAKISVTPL